MITNLIAKYKARRVKDVVNRFMNVTVLTSELNVPTILRAQRRAAHIIIDKTYEDPSVASNLIDAINAAIKHYGPALQALGNEVLGDLQANAEYVEDSRAATLLADAINDITKD